MYMYRSNINDLVPHGIGGRVRGRKKADAAYQDSRWHPDAVAYCTYVGINRDISGKDHPSVLLFISTWQPGNRPIHAGTVNNNDQDMDCTHTS
eukprot:scaffold1333_cov130-Skeletonema_dohrnii-CCMP3373.AAC.9